jgi:hypothetical protein
MHARVHFARQMWACASLREGRARVRGKALGHCRPEAFKAFSIHATTERIGGLGPCEGESHSDKRRSPCCLCECPSAPKPASVGVQGVAAGALRSEQMSRSMFEV